MKKILSIILSLLMISSAFTGLNITVNASEISSAEVSSSESDFVYGINDYGEAVIQGYNGSDSDVIIPDSIDGYMVTEIASGAFTLNENIVSVVIPETVLEVGESAFEECRNLRSVYISEYANVHEIQSWTFANCTSLQEVILPQHLNIIGDMAFYNCTSLEYIVIPEETTEISVGAFDCVYPDFAIHGYSGSYAEVYAKEFGFQFVSLGVSENNSKYAYEYYDGGIMITGYYGYDSMVEIPEQIDGLNVVAIGENAFASNPFIVEVVIPVTVKSIGMNAFRDCYHLQYVNSAEMDNSNVEIISDYAFSGCNSLYYVLGRLEYVREIGNYAFENCHNLEWLYIGEYIERIGDCAFDACGSMEYIIFDGESGVYREIEISDYAFGGVYFISYIIGARDSYIHHYALDHNINFVSFGDYIDEETGFTYILDYTDYAGAIITGYIGTDMGLSTELTIPETITGYDGYYNYEVVAIYDHAFEDNLTITSVVIPETVLELGEGCFSDCDNLTSVTLSDGLKTIGRYAFAGCDSLKSIVIPKETTIGEEAFSDYPDLVMYGYSNSPAQYYAQENNITFVCLDAPVDVPEFTYEIDENQEVIITGYTGTDTDIIIPDMIDGCMVTTIGERAFFDSDITSVEFPETLINICENAFEHCNELTEINIPASVQYIESEAFRDCNLLRAFTVDTENIFYSSVEGVLYDKDCTTIIRCPIALACEKFELAPTTKIISDHAFDKCINIAEINLVDGLEKIGSFAFAGCGKLTEIVIPDSVTEIGEYAFAACGLTTITLSNGISKIPAYAFECCNRLESIVIPNSVTTIGTASFIVCTNLKTIVIPETVIEIEGLAFQECDSLTSITLPDELQALGDYAFYGCDNLISIVIPESIEKINLGTFRACDSLTSITLHNGIQSIGSQSFKDCISLTEIVIPKETTIDDTAFEGANPEIVMYGYTNSPAQAYAKESGINFIALDVLKGDIGGDGVVNINDVTDIQTYISGTDELTEEQLYAADVDGDGIVSVRDATYIQKYLAGIVDTI